MFVKTLSVPLMLVTMGLFSSHSHAMAPLSSEHLAELCANYQTEPNNQKSIQCARYIKGFIDGAIAADSDVEKNQSAASKSVSSFKERAIKSRIGNRVDLEAGKSVGEFCLGKPVVISEVIKTVATKVSAVNYQDQSALSAMQTILKENYPCLSS